MNIGSGWEQKSIMQRCPFIFIIRTENSRNNQTVGRKATLRLRTSFRKPQAVTLSSLAWWNRQQPARIGRWRMVSDKVDFLAGNCMGAMPDTYKNRFPFISTHPAKTGFHRLLPLHFNFCLTTLKNEASGSDANGSVFFALRMVTTDPRSTCIGLRPSNVKNTG